VFDSEKHLHPSHIFESEERDYRSGKILAKKFYNIAFKSLFKFATTILGVQPFVPGDIVPNAIPHVDGTR
jgi:hypothetical protein